MQSQYRILQIAFLSVCAVFLLGLASGVVVNLSGHRELGEQVFRFALWICGVAFLAYVYSYWRLCRELRKSFVLWVFLWTLFLPFAFLYSYFAMRSLVVERAREAVPS